MNENRTDKLFRDNSEYLADQPHGDFDPVAFWQQLQPELLNQNKTRKSSNVTLFGWQSVAAVLLFILLTVGTYRTFNIDNSVTTAAVKPEKVIVDKDTERTAFSENQNYTSHKKQKSISVKTQKQPEIIPIETAPIPDVLPPTEPVVRATDKEKVKHELRPEEPMQTQSKSETSEVRIVHRNELRNQEKQHKKARTQLTARLGIPAAQQPATSSGGDEIPLKISIHKVIN